MASLACSRSRAGSRVAGPAASPRFTSAELANMMKRPWRSGPPWGGAPGPWNAEPAGAVRGAGAAGAVGAGAAGAWSMSSRPRLSVTLNVSSSAMRCLQAMRCLLHGGRPEPSMRSQELQGANPLVYNALATSGLLMADSAGVLFEALLSLMGRLRGEGGCPWDREQTHASLKLYLIEEAYEALDALDEGRTDHIGEELGDVLFQVVFHCQIAQERGEFTMAEVLQEILRKMTSRHPHVFANAQVADARQAL